MSLKHNSPEFPRRKDGHEYWARAPYNFVPLSEEPLTVEEPLSHDCYHDNGLTGWLECTLKTCSPVYVRGMLLEAVFREQRQKLLQANQTNEAAEDEQDATELSVEEKLQLAPFFATTEEEVEGKLRPVIPGSTVRGMVRMLVEIIGHGRMRWVANQPILTFRAVAAQRRDRDPLLNPYEKAIGRNGRHVRAGYLERKGENWSVQPSLTPKQVGWSNRAYEQYVKVEDEDINDTDLPDFKHFDDLDYRPQVREVSFERGRRKPKRNKPEETRPSVRISSADAGYKHRGVLVTSGNMLETADEDRESPRRKHAIVLPRDETKPPIPVRDQAVKDYLNGLTPFQSKKLEDWAGGEWGCLAHGKPIFYVAEGNEVVYFGHSPNFRIPAQLNGVGRAATPHDFVPKKHRQRCAPDLADAIFGWVEEENEGPAGHRAGRVFFENAHFDGASDGVWYTAEPITPHVLASPKPTTFQHYLVQDREAGHDPDDKASLAHYGTSPEETQIRGYKLYWHKGDSPDIEATPEERQHESQLTRIVPLKPGVRFQFTIYFENLRDEELGAMLWALSLPGEQDKVYRHKLGMGKPLGMGAVAITPRLFISRRTPDNSTDEPSRYEKLFSDHSWHTAVVEADPEPYLDQFESFMIDDNSLVGEGTPFAELERVQMLLAMLEWRQGSEEWLDKTRYMEIERPTGRRRPDGQPETFNEYKERPVLPDPLAVIGESTPRSQPRPSTTPQPDRRQPPRQPKPEPSPRFQPGNAIRGRVYEIDPDTGDVYFEIEGIPADKLLGHIAAPNLVGRQYQVGHTAACIVLKVDEHVVECKPKPRRK